MSLGRIARISGVSTSTVSRVINNDPRISSVTAERIKGIIAEAGYTPKSRHPRRARRVPARPGIRTGNVALVEIGEHSYGSSLGYAILRGATLRLADHGINMITAFITDDTLPPCLAQHQVDGIIVRGNPSKKVARQLQEFPSVWITSHHTSSGDYVIGGHDTGGRLAARHLLSRGHNRLAFLNVWPDHPAFRAKAEGFELAARKDGASVELIEPRFDEGRPPGVSEMSGFAEIEELMEPLVDRLLKIEPLPSGLFVPADMFAAILYRLLYKRNVRPGYDVEVISANNEGPYLAGLYPRPATIDIGGERIGQSAVDQLLLRVQYPEKGRGLRMIIEPIVIEGESIDHEENVSWT